MPGRIATLQRQARELGRLRTGYTTKAKNGKTRPTRSETWIITSPAKHYIEAAAAEWGGQVEDWQPQGNGAAQYRVVTDATSLEAILPPGDPLSQAYELWNKGGCVRRCDGVSEDLSRAGCICRAKYGEDFGTRDDIPVDEVCKITTRLNMILPAMPDLGAFRFETHSYYAANEIAGSVDTIRGLVGAEAMIPVRLRIEQRTRVAGGETKHFPVVAVELRGPTAGELLAGKGAVASLGQNGNGQRPAIEASAAPAETETSEEPAQPHAYAQGEPVDWRGQAMAVKTPAQAEKLWAEAQQAGVLEQDRGLRIVLTQRRKEVASASEQQPEPAAEPEAEGERQALWTQVLTARPANTTAETQQEFAAYAGGQAFSEVDIAVCREYAADVTGVNGVNA